MFFIRLISHLRKSPATRDTCSYGATNHFISFSIPVKLIHMFLVFFILAQLASLFPSLMPPPLVKLIRISFLSLTRLAATRHLH